ncbi:MAG: hypothetical protein ACT4NV_14795 [Rhodoferax sp.]
MTFTFDHAECAVLATVFIAMPRGVLLPKLNHGGLPEFEVCPVEAREACRRLRLRGFVVQAGPYVQLTAAGKALFANLEETISGGCHD